MTLIASLKVVMVSVMLTNDINNKSASSNGKWQAYSLC